MVCNSQSSLITTYFCSQGDAVANHPNQWFQASVNYHKLKNGQTLGGPAAPPADSSASATSSSFVQASSVVKPAAAAEMAVGYVPMEL